MKKQKLIMILALVPTIAFGSLIDLTPGGWHTTDPEPQAFTDFLLLRQPQQLLFFDQMYATTTNGFGPGWVSQFGVLNGGVYFFAHIDQSGPVPFTTISWDFGDSGYFMKYILVDGLLTTSDNFWENLYGVRNRDLFQGEGTITINGIVDINSIAFYGKNLDMVPDYGSTLGLFLIGLIGLYASSHYRFKSIP
jgi:hypothetical protein